MAKKAQAQPIIVLSFYRNCYIRPSAKNSEQDQRAAIAATGPMSGKHAKTVVGDLDRLLNTARPGEEFVVAELQCLGDDLPAVMGALKMIQERDLIVVEAATGRRFHGAYDGAAAGLAAAEYFRKRSLSTMAAKRAGKAGAEKRYEDLHAGRVPLDEAVRRWNDAVRRGATAPQAIAAVNAGYAMELPYRTFRNYLNAGKLPGMVESLPAGRRRKS